MKNGNSNLIKFAIILSVILFIFSGCSSQDSLVIVPQVADIQNEKLQSNSSNTSASNLTPSFELPIMEICNNSSTPVCGADGKTYNNACLANASNVVIVGVGICEKAKSIQTVDKEELAACQSQPQDIVCGFSSFYNQQMNFRNPCVADLLDATDVEAGACSS